MVNIITSIITDCADPATRGRQELRFNALFGVKPTFLGVSSYSSIEAAGNLIDQLDVLLNFPLGDQERENIILVNVAPRAQESKHKWDNGTPFCYFRIKNALVVSTYAGYCLALARDFGIIDSIELLDVPTVTAAAVEWGDLTPQEAGKINNSQFRSLEFLPVVAYWLWKGRPVPSSRQSLEDLPSPKNKAWLIDNFDLVKTTLLPEEINFRPGNEVKLSDGSIAVCYTRLTDVPKGVTALTIGSSGFGTERFLEVAVGGCGQAASRHGLKIGSSVTA